MNTKLKSTKKPLHDILRSFNGMELLVSFTLIVYLIFSNIMAVHAVGSLGNSSSASASTQQTTESVSNCHQSKSDDAVVIDCRKYCNAITYALPSESAKNVVIYEGFLTAFFIKNGYRAKILSVDPRPPKQSSSIYVINIIA